MRVRVGYERVLLLGAADEELPVVEPSGLRLSGLAFFVRFDRVFESPAGGEPAGASELNRLLRVSFDHVNGIGFHPLEGLDCGREVVSWLVEEADPCEPEVAHPRPVEREVFDELLERHWDLFVEDARLSSTAYQLFPLDVAASGGRSSLGAGVGGRSA